MAVRLRRDTGKWLADVRDAFGRRRQVTFDTKESAKDFEAEQRRARRMGRFATFDPETTLGAYSESWLATRSVKSTTRTLYGAALRLHILPALGRLRVVEVTRERVRRYLAEKLRNPAASLQGQRPKREKRRRARALHRNSVRNQLKLLSGILNAAAADQLIPANPLQGLGRELFGRTRRGFTRKVRALDEEQLGAFLEAARRRPDTFPAFAVMALTGLRLGEAAALRWEDADWRTSRLNIARQLSGSLKTPESERQVDIPRGLLELLRQLQAERREDAFRNGRGESPWLLFPDLPALPTSTDETRIGHRVRREMVRALKAAGVATAFTPHALRHSYASRLISDGVSPEYVRRQLGHANIGITLDLYGRWLPMAAPEGALERLAAPLARPGCNESATNGGGTELLATGTDGGSVASSRYPATYPHSPCTCT
jgi:integrase